MTYEEAREILRMGCCYVGYNHKKCTECEYALAFEALGKQTPKKPIERIVDTGLNLKIPYKIYLCPNHRCRMTVKQFDEYCHECWQRIDWREENESQRKKAFG